MYWPEGRRRQCSVQTAIKQTVKRVGETNRRAARAEWVEAGRSETRQAAMANTWVGSRRRSSGDWSTFCCGSHRASFTICFNFKCLVAGTAAAWMLTRRVCVCVCSFSSHCMWKCVCVWACLCGTSLLLLLHTQKNYQWKCFHTAFECEKVGPALKQCQRQRQRVLARTGCCCSPKEMPSGSGSVGQSGMLLVVRARHKRICWKCNAC